MFARIDKQVLLSTNTQIRTLYLIENFIWIQPISTNDWDSYVSEIAKDKYIFVCINIRVDGKVSCEGYSSCDS